MSYGKKRLQITFNSPAVLGFTAACLAVLLIDSITGGKALQTVFSTYRSGLLDPLTYVRLFTHVLGHENWSHLIGNLMYILILGPLLEEKYGSRNILILIAATALVTGVLNSVLFPNIRIYGASGVVFAMIVLSSITDISEHSIPLTFILVVLLYLGQQIYEAVTVHSNISHMAHIAGGATGAVLGFLMNTGKKKRFS